VVPVGSTLRLTETQPTHSCPSITRPLVSTWQCAVFRQTYTCSAPGAAPDRHSVTHLPLGRAAYIKLARVTQALSGVCKPQSAPPSTGFCRSTRRPPEIQRPAASLRGPRETQRGSRRAPASDHASTARDEPLIATTLISCESCFPPSCLCLNETSHAVGQRCRLRDDDDDARAKCICRCPAPKLKLRPLSASPAAGRLANPLRRGGGPSALTPLVDVQT